MRLLRACKPSCRSCSASSHIESCSSMTSYGKKYSRTSSKFYQDYPVSSIDAKYCALLASSLMLCLRPAVSQRPMCSAYAARNFRSSQTSRTRPLCHMLPICDELRDILEGGDHNTSAGTGRRFSLAHRQASNRERSKYEVHIGSNNEVVHALQEQAPRRSKGQYHAACPEQPSPPHIPVLLCIVSIRFHFPHHR